jgi:hypothetical protein
MMPMFRSFSSMVRGLSKKVVKVEGTNEEARA